MMLVQDNIRVTVEATKQGYYSVPITVNVLMQDPIIVTRFDFETGESITISPENSGEEVSVTKGCHYFDITFTDYLSLIHI